MSRPTASTISSGLEAWDVAIGDNFDLIFTTPVPLASYTFSALPAAASYAQCLAVTSDNNRLAYSDGTNWHNVPVQGSSQSNASGWADSTAQANFNSLLALLRASNAIGP